ncbi:hypothetical protein HDV01_004917 [Terramyces sp. JEL0728]|nr:hypothetical protein HDV01_004917 [Terramyces sp. JEL0728]
MNDRTNERFGIEAPFISDSLKTLKVDDDEDEITPLKKVKETRVSSFNGLIYFDDPQYEQLERKDSAQMHYKRYCCIFKTKSGCVRAFLTLLWLLFLSIVIAGFILYPANPKIDIGNPYVIDPIHGLNVNFSSHGLDSIELQIGVDYTVHSDNYYDIFVSKVTTRPMQITYKYDSQGVRGDRTIYVINNTILSDPTKPVFISYSIDIDIPLVSWTGYTITKSGTMSFGLHDLSAAAADAVLAKLKTVFALLK